VRDFRIETPRGGGRYLIKMSFNICRIVRSPDDKDAVPAYSFDASHVKVTDAKKLNKGRFAGVRYKGGPLYFETPFLHSPMDVSGFEDSSKRSLFLSLRGHEDDGDVKAFIAALEGVEEKIIDSVVDAKWLGDSINRDTAGSLMSRIVKSSESTHRPSASASTRRTASPRSRRS
jgi:hypothetical protein